MQANRCLQIRPLQSFTQHTAKFAVHANIHISFHQARHIGQVTAQRKHHVHFSTNAVDQAFDFRQIAGTVEGAVAGTNDVDAWFFTGRTLGKRFASWYFFQTILGPQPIHGPVGTLPLVFVNRAR